MTRTLDSILDQCLSQIAAGKATMWNCLARYPDLAGELEPLLLAAEDMWAIPKPILAPQAKARIEARLLGAVEARSQLRSTASDVPSRWRWAVVGFGAIFIILLSLTVLVDTVGETLPGSPLHTIKLATEDTWLWLAPAREEPRLHLRFARRRLDEVEALTVRGSVDLTVVEAMTRQTEAALAGVKGLPPAVAVPLADDLVALIADQKSSLSALDGLPQARSKDAPTLQDKATTVVVKPAAPVTADSAETAVAVALQANAEQEKRAQALVSALPMPPSIAISTMANPNRVPEPGGVVQFTVRVTNSGVEDVTLTALVDDAHGDLDGQGSCKVFGPGLPAAMPRQGIKLGPGEFYECTFHSDVVGNAGDGESRAVTVIAADDEGNIARISASATVGITDVLPTISVVRTASVSSVPEPGDMVKFTVRVTNNSVEEVTLTALKDDLYSDSGRAHGEMARDLSGRGDCFVPPEGIALAPGESYRCTFSGDVFGNASADTVGSGTVTALAADDEGNSVKASGSATVAITDVLPQISVATTASPSSVPEPGGPVQFTVRVSNHSVEGVSLTSLVDNLAGADVGSGEPVGGSGGNLNGRGSCSVPPEGIALGVGGWYECTFSADVAGNARDHAGGIGTRTVTAVAVDDERNQIEASGSAMVRISDVQPVIAVFKSVEPRSVPEPGDTVRFTVRITNHSVEDVTLTSLLDDIHGDLNGRGTCSVTRREGAGVVGLTLSPGGSYECTFSTEVTGNAGDSETDTVTAVVTDDEGNKTKSADSDTVTVADMLPRIAVRKVATPASVTEPGGTVLFVIRVTNDSVEEVRLTSLVDEVHGDLNGRGTCSVSPTSEEGAFGTTIAARSVLGPGGVYTCSFRADVIGNAGDRETGTVTAVATDDEGNRAKAADKTSVSITDVKPVIAVFASAEPQSVPEPGEIVQFTVRVTNHSVEDVTLTSLVDDIYGDLNGRGTCSVSRRDEAGAVGIVLGPGGSYKCTFRAEVTGNGGDHKTDTVTAKASDDEGNQAAASGSATVTVADVAPVIAVTTTAMSLSVPEPGDTVQFAVEVTNDGVEDVRLISLVDEVAGAGGSDGDLEGRGTCNVTAGVIVLSPGGSYRCIFKAEVTGNAGDIETRTVTAQVADDEGNQVEASGGAAVSMTDVLPAITVRKMASPMSVPEPGSTVQFTVRVTNDSVEDVRLTSLVDDIHGDLNGQGTCSWPRREEGGAAGITLNPGSSYKCTFGAHVAGNAGDTETGRVAVRASDDDGNRVVAFGRATVAITDALPQIVVSETASPDSVPEPGGMAEFRVQVTNNSREEVSLLSLVNRFYGDLNGHGTCSVPLGGLTIARGESYRCAFSVSVTGNAGAHAAGAGADTVSAVVSDDEGNQVEASGSATVSITDVPPEITVVILANPISLPEPGGAVQFTVRVTNGSVEEVRLTSLVDDVYGDLDGRGTCQVSAVPAAGTILGPGGWYECTFGADVMGNAGENATNSVTAVAVDDEGNRAEALGTATVTITDVPPAITVVGSAEPSSVPEPGDTVQFIVRVTNSSIEDVTLISLVDDVHGDLDGKGTCLVPSEGIALSPGWWYECAFNADVFGNAGDSQMHTVRAAAVDDEGNRAEAVGSITVEIVSP